MVLHWFIDRLMVIQIIMHGYDCIMNGKFNKHVTISGKTFKYSSFKSNLVYAFKTPPAFSLNYVLVVCMRYIFNCM